MGGEHYITYKPENIHFYCILIQKEIIKIEFFLVQKIFKKIVKGVLILG